MSDCSSDRNIDEKKADGCVGKSAGGLMFVKLIGQQEGCNSDGRGFCYERTQQGGNHQD